MKVNVPPSELATLLDTINPISVAAAGTAATAWIPAKGFAAFLISLQVGAMATGATLDAVLEQAINVSGDEDKEIAGKSITQLTKAGTDDNKQVEINLRPEELDINGGYTHFRLLVSAAVEASLVCAQVRGFHARNAPETDDTTVDEVIL